jgi:membrane protease subunit HflC
MRRLLFFVVLVLAVIVFSTSAYTVGETEQVIITEFGRPVGAPIRSAGLHFRTPFVETVRRFEKRVLRWDGEPREISTREKKFIFVEPMARWRISDPLLFLQTVGDLNNAQQRLDNIIDGVVKDTVSSQVVIDVVRASDRAMLSDVDVAAGPEVAAKVAVGRPKLLRQIADEAASRLSSLGIELLDVRITRVIFVEKVLEDVYRRMISERQRIAARFRSEGEGERAKILGQLEKEEKRIRSEAARDAEKTRGDADATAARTYADAYQRDPEFYGFVKSLETLRSSLVDGKSTLVLSPQGDLLGLLRSSGATKKGE